MHNLIIMGPPGAGKGTQSEKIVAAYNIPHISTGDMFREAISKKTELGTKAEAYIKSGALVPDEITIGLVKERLSMDDCKNGYLLDGFPRTILQAEALRDLTKEIGREVTLVINLVCDYESLAGRISQRRVCPKCGASYHLVTKKPEVEGICDNCKTPLIQREDDTMEALKTRLNAYEMKTKPLIEFYEKENLIKNIDGLQSIDDVFSDIKKALEGK